MTIASGATISNAGTAAGFGGTGEITWDTTVKTTGTFTATAGVGYFLNTGGGTITVNLPAGAAGSSVALADYAGTFQANGVTVSPNGTDKIGSEVGGDPLLKLKSRELDLKARADQDKNANNEARLDLDTMRAMMNDQQHDEKLEQNEELAGLRAGVSIAKQQMADQSKRHDFGRNFKKN